MERTKNSTRTSDQAVKHYLAKKLLLVTGKGGVGKSLCSLLIARDASRLGKKVLIVESSAFDKLAPMCGAKPIGHREVELYPGVWGINLDPKKCFEEYVCLHLGIPSLYERVFSSGVVASFLDAIPGLDEVMLLGRLFYTSELADKGYDLIIFDAPATGHFVNMMTTPETIVKSGLMGPLVKEVAKVLAFLKDTSKVANILVTTTEPLVMSETLEFVELASKGLPVCTTTLVVNRQACSAWLLSPELKVHPSLHAYLETKVLRYQMAIRKLEHAKLSGIEFLSVPDRESLDEPVTFNMLDQLGLGFFPLAFTDSQGFGS